MNAVKVRNFDAVSDNLNVAVRMCSKNYAQKWATKT